MTICRKQYRNRKMQLKFGLFCLRHVDDHGILKKWISGDVLWHKAGAGPSIITN